VPRLDRFISDCENVNRRSVRLLLAQGRIRVDGEPAQSISQVVSQFQRVTLDERVLQETAARYVMLHKPPAVVSATQDPQHPTVIDLLPQPYADSLHISGRLDFNTTGLMLLTNDGRWSRALSEPTSSIAKTYIVSVQKPLTEDYVEAFAAGMYFDYEGLTTRPAGLRILSEFEAEVSLVEGRYHQIKRMFGQFDNKVIKLHRSAIGSLRLDPALAVGDSRELHPGELDALGIAHQLAG
jgi:16S rRNA pseudouridine516 synthase